MIRFFKKLFEKNKREIAYVTCLPLPPDFDDEYDYGDISEYNNDEDYDTAESEEDTSSEVSYDSDIDFQLSKVRKSYNDPFIGKFNHIAELKRQLCFYRDFPYGRRWFLYYSLNSIKEIGFYPPGMPFNKTDIINMIYRHQKAMKDRDGINLAPYHKYLVGEDSYEKFELIAKSPVEPQFYSTGVDETGQTLLHHAARWNNYDLAKKLLELGFDVNAVDYNEKTPIFSCVGKLHHRKSKMADLLLKYGANPYHKMGNKTLLDKAVQKGNIHLTILLVTKYGFEFGLRKKTFRCYPTWAQKKLVKYWLSECL